jgi:predicted nucleic acid-binding protein
VKRFVFDASALIVFLEDLPGAAKVENLLAMAIEGKSELLISTVNWGEVYHLTWRAHGEVAARKAIVGIRLLPIQVTDATSELTNLAVALRARNKIPYTGCFAAALAQQNRAVLVTADRHFVAVENDMKIIWATEE